MNLHSFTASFLLYGEHLTKNFLLTIGQFFQAKIGWINKTKIDNSYRECNDNYNYLLFHTLTIYLIL